MEMVLFFCFKKKVVDKSCEYKNLHMIIIVTKYKYYIKYLMLLSTLSYNVEKVLDIIK